MASPVEHGERAYRARRRGRVGSWWGRQGVALHFPQHSALASPCYSQRRERQGVQCLARRDLRAPNAPMGLRSNGAEERRRERRHKEKKLEGKDKANL